MWEQFYFSILIAGFGGGMVRALFGFFKQFSYKTPKFETLYFFVMVFISGIIGLLTAVVIKELGLNFFGLGEFTPALAFIVGYAGGDFLESVYKIVLKKTSIFEAPAILVKNFGKEMKFMSKKILKYSAFLLLFATIFVQMPSRVFATDLTTSLVSYWKLDEASGTRVDSVGSNNLTDNNTVTQAVGKLGNSAQFTMANSEYLSISDNPSLSVGNTDFTISAWIYLDTKATHQLFVGKYNTTGEYALFYRSSTDKLVFSTYPSLEALVTPTGGVQTGQWYFIVATHNATTHTNTITVNNTYTNTSAAGSEPADTTGEFTIGRFLPSGNTFYTNGRIDSVGFWKRILTSDEGTSLYNSGTGLEYPFSTLAAGSISLTDRTDSSIDLLSAEATGGTAPYTYQWYRSESTGFTPGAGNILSGKTSLTLSDTGLSAGTTYYYKLRVTDSVSATADSSEFSATTLAPPATSFTFTGPSSGTVDTASTNFTVTPNGEYTGTITPSSTGAGTFTPVSLSWSGSSDAKTFTYTPTSTSGSPHTISVSASPSLTNSSGNISFTVNEKTTYYQILSTGQSLATVYYASPAISVTQPYNNLMLTPGVEGTSAPLIPLIESGQGEGGNVETISSGMANSIHAFENLSTPIVVGLHAHSGTAYSGLKKGTSWYNKGMTQASVTKTYVENTLGGIYRPLAITSIHGESDYVGGAGANYKSYLEEWQSDYETDLNTLTSRSDTIPLFIDQMNSAPTGEIAEAQLNAHIEDPGKVILVGPKYQYHYRSDKLHMDVNTQEKQMGEMYAKVMSKVLFEDETWDPLMPSSILRSGNIITVNYHIPYGNLAIDTTNVAERPDYGFEFAQTGGNSVSIDSVELINNNSQVKITLSDTPTGTSQHLRYAWSCYISATWCAQAGDATAVGGNIRDTDTSVSPASDSTGLALYDWGVTFNEPITTTYTITPSAGANGSISPSGATTVNSGDNQTFTITANSGYHISDILVDGSSVGAVSSYTFNNVTTDHTISATFDRTSSGGGGGCYGCYVNPAIPSGGFKISINSGASTTSNRNVFLGFNAGVDIKKMAISMTGDFTDASQENYTASKQWDLCSKLGGAVKNPTCPDGKYTVYAKFYTAYGRSSDASVASSTITLKSGYVEENLQQYTNLPFTNPFTKYLQYRQTNADIKRLQIFLNADPDTKIADTGAGSPGKETNYFGLLTYKAVIKFQEKYAKDILDPWGFKKGTGYVGKTTLAKINELMKNK